jgi:hypothetical protein
MAKTDPYGTLDLVTEIPSTLVSFDADAFDEAIRSQGVRLVHYQALPCPVGLTNLDDNRRPHEDHAGCTNGFLYGKAGVVTGLFTGNSKHKVPDEMGFWDSSTVQISLPRFYDECDQRLYIAPFDRLYLDDEHLNVVTWQRYIHSDDGVDRLKYPVVEVVRLVDNAGIVYQEGDDFVVQQGLIKWVGRQPVPLTGTDSDRGAICAIRYTYRPYWYVGQLMHELRVTQITGDTGRHTEKMPQQILAHREYVAQTKDQQPPGSAGTGVDADMMRTVMSPMYGGFGPK